MAELIAKTHCAGLLPLTIGALRLTERASDDITSIAPFTRQEEAVSDLLKQTIGHPLPGPGATCGDDATRLICMGRGQVLLVCAPVPEGLDQLAALTDQSDGWAMMRLSGAGASDVLSRLCPLDLRRTTFAIGQTARTELAHMMASVTRIDAQVFDLMVMRSFARTAVHDLNSAMKSVLARAG